MAGVSIPMANLTPGNGPGQVNHIEDYPSGYPQASALISSHPSLHLFRRFTRLRARLTLQKQDRLSVLEHELDELDRTEPKRLFLGTLRGDQNAARKSLCDQIDVALKDYDSFLERSEKMIARVSPKARDVDSLQNWTENTSSISLEETKYLWDETDLFTLGGLGRDEIVKAFEGPLEDAVFWCQRLTKSNSSLVSRDTNVHFTSRPRIEALAHFFLACLLVLILLGPVVTLASLQSFSARVSVLMISCVLFVASLLILVKTKPGETFMASVAYAAVLVVFFQN